MLSSSRKSNRPKPKRIPSLRESARNVSRTLSKVPSKIRKTVRSVFVGKTYTYNEPKDLLGYNTITHLMFIDPLEINPNILKKGPGELSKEQLEGLNELLKIKEMAERDPPEERYNTINRLKNKHIKKIDSNSKSNHEEDEVNKEFTKDIKGLKLSKGGNRRTHNRRTRKRM